MATNRRRIPKTVRLAVLAEAGYRCATPTCRTILAIDLHHLTWVSEGGPNDASNLLALCPTCHALHHRGEIPREALTLWKASLRPGAARNESRSEIQAEKQLTKPTRPWLIIDGYSTKPIQDDETGEEYLSESVHIVNRGEAVAVSINPHIHLAGKTVHLYGPLPTLGPSESIDANIWNFRETLEYVHFNVRDKLQEPLKGSRALVVLLPLRVPLIIKYRDLKDNRWETEHIVSFTGGEATFSLVHPNDSPQWTELPTLGNSPYRATQ